MTLEELLRDKGLIYAVKRKLEIEAELKVLNLKDNPYINYNTEKINDLWEDNNKALRLSYLNKIKELCNPIFEHHMEDMILLKCSNRDDDEFCFREYTPEIDQIDDQPHESILGGWLGNQVKLVKIESLSAEEYKNLEECNDILEDMGETLESNFELENVNIYWYACIGLNRKGELKKFICRDDGLLHNGDEVLI